MKDCKLKRKLLAIYEVFYEARRIFILRTAYRLHIMTSKNTLHYIAKHNCSIARYGDGEFDLITSSRDLKFQSRDPDLANRLSEVLKRNDPRLLLCVPRCLNTVAGCTDHAASFWIDWGRRNDHHKEVVNLIRAHAGPYYSFGDSLITRPFIDWTNPNHAKHLYPMLKQLWQDRDILIVEGAQSRLGVGNDLFSNTRSIKRILAPSINAFQYYDEIKNVILNHYQGELILVALGPTATVLAADLSARDIQILDIGNIDIEYEWFLRNERKRVAIPGKFTNEAKGVQIVADCNDEAYISQIIARVGC